MARMNFRIFFTILTIGTVVFLTASCKKDEEETDTSLSLSGFRIEGSLPSYVAIGDRYTFDIIEPSRESSDESDALCGIAWNYSLLSNSKDTLRHEGDGADVQTAYSITIPDTLCSFTVTAYAFADGYYTSSADFSAVIINPSKENGSLTNVNISSGAGRFTDPRDGRTYRYTTRAGLDWMCENLAYSASGRPFMSSPVMTDVFGMYYTWDEAQNVCPKEWRLPSNLDWMSLANCIRPSAFTDAYGMFDGVTGDMMADGYLNGSKLWTFWPEVRITNSTDISILPTGFATVSNGNYNYRNSGVYSCFWTSEEKDAEQAYYRYAHVKQANLLLGYSDKDSFAIPVRCVRDAQ